MKYIVQQNSVATLNGYIHNNDDFEDEYNNKDIVITNNFLQYEHTDGLNYVHIAVGKEKKLLESKNRKANLTATIGLNAGMLIPRSDVTLMHYARNNKFHVAGYGLGVNAGLKGTFLKYCFIRLDNKTGFINMPDVLTRGTNYKDRAKQHFGFIEFFYSFGIQIPL